MWLAIVVLMLSLALAVMHLEFHLGLHLGRALLFSQALFISFTQLFAFVGFDLLVQSSMKLI